MKTDSMTRFDYLYLGSMILDLFVVIAGWDWIVMAIHDEVHLQGGGPDMEAFMSGLAPYFVAISFALGFLMWMLISVFRFQIFRWVLAILVGLDIVSFLLDFVFAPEVDIFYLADFVSLALVVGAVYFVFQPDAGAWLREEV